MPVLPTAPSAERFTALVDVGPAEPDGAVEGGAVADGGVRGGNGAGEVTCDASVDESEPVDEPEFGPEDGTVTGGTTDGAGPEEIVEAPLDDALPACPGRAA